MIEYVANTRCIPARDLIEHGLMTQASYAKSAQRKRINVVSQGKGRGNRAMVAIDSLPLPLKIKVDELFGGKKACLAAWVRSHYVEDQKAIEFYNNEEKTGGITLSDEKKREYLVNASVLNACIKMHDNAAVSSKLHGKSYDWEEMANAIESLREQYGHTLPTSTLRFRKKVNDYRKYGYGSLISKKYGNQCARLLTEREETVIKGIAILPNKPWNTHVREMYRMFICGELLVWHPDTGELLDPELFARKKDGEPWIPSETTINNFLNRLDIATLIKNRVLPSNDYYHEDMPHVHRHSGQYSLSQITMDDVNLSRRMHGDKQVMAYYAYDMVSQCILGASYSDKKNEALVDECFREMFRLIKRRRWGIPAGVEVENHLMSRFKNDFLKEGTVFSRVRFCAPQNHQEKYSEPLNGAKKRSIIHKNHEHIGRFYGKGKWKVYYDKVSDETNQTWLAKKYYTFEELVADDRRDNAEWNNSLHSDQDRYPGMTRWEVLIANINPDLRDYDEKTIARYVGEKVNTSIRRNSTVRVCHEDWWISRPEVLGKLAPNNKKVEAYYLPTEDGRAENVYIYQNGKYIDTLEKVLPFNRIMAEQTEEDKRRLGIQMKKINDFRTYLKANTIQTLMVMEVKPGDKEEYSTEMLTVDPEPRWDEEDETLSPAGYSFGDMETRGKEDL